MSGQQVGVTNKRISSQKQIWRHESNTPVTHWGWDVGYGIYSKPFGPGSLGKTDFSDRTHHHKTQIPEKSNQVTRRRPDTGIQHTQEDKEPVPPTKVSPSPVDRLPCQHAKDSSAVFQKRALKFRRCHRLSPEHRRKNSAWRYRKNGNEHHRVDGRMHI